MKERYDRIIIGAGFYGLYAAHHCGKKKEKVLSVTFILPLFF